jgi:hypothetical protein
VFTKGHHDEFYVSGQQLANNITDQYNKLSLCICKSTAITTIKCIEMTLVVTNKHFYFSTLFTTDSTRLSDLYMYSYKYFTYTLLLVSGSTLKIRLNLGVSLTNIDHLISYKTTNSYRSWQSLVIKYKPLMSVMTQKSGKP